MVDEFVRLCEIESPSRGERAMADAVAAELREIGLEPSVDGSHTETGSVPGWIAASRSRGSSFIARSGAIAADEGRAVSRHSVAASRAAAPR